MRDRDESSVLPGVAIWPSQVNCPECGTWAYAPGEMGEPVDGHHPGCPVGGRPAIAAAAQAEAAGIIRRLLLSADASWLDGGGHDWPEAVAEAQQWLRATEET